MLLTVKGLVLRETPYGEADKLIDLLTDEGVITVRARGARKPGSKYAALTQLFSYAEFCLRQSHDHFFLDSAVPIQLFYGIRNDLEALALAAYFSELTRKIATAQPQPQILRLFLYCLHYLSVHSRPLPQIKSIFELRMLTELGMMPDLLCCSACGEYLPQQLVLRIANGDFRCSECHPNNQTTDLSVTVGVLQAARHIVFSDFDRLFHYRLQDRSQQLLSLFTEQYACYRLELRCKTLRFYHSLTDGCTTMPLSQPDFGTDYE